MSNSVFAKILGELEEASGKLFDTYISGDSPREVNILYASKTKMAADMKENVLHPNMFAIAFHHIAAMLIQNFLNKFLVLMAKEGPRADDSHSISPKRSIQEGDSPVATSNVAMNPRMQRGVAMAPKLKSSAAFGSSSLKSLSNENETSSMAEKTRKAKPVLLSQGRGGRGGRG